MKFRAATVLLRCAIALATVALVLPCEVRAQPQDVERSDDDLLLLSLVLEHEVLAETLPAYPVKDAVLLPLGEVCRQLGLAVEVSPAEGTADGFVISEGRRFHLDAHAHRAVVDGHLVPVPAEAIEQHDEDLFVDARQLQAWFPVDFELDLNGAAVTVRPREALPLQIRRAREKQIERTLANLHVSGPRYPSTPLPYSLIDVPFVDQTVTASLQPRRRGGFGAADLQYATLASGDLLWLESSLYVAGNLHGLNALRVRMGREDPEGELLGPLHATEAAVGEVLFPGADLIALPYSGPGLLVTNRPLEAASQFDRHSFRGELPRGWDVELFRNDALIAWQQSNEEGRFEFLDVPLLFGLNTFRLVFHGPQGQQREQTEIFHVDAGETPRGQWRYRIAANGRDLLTLAALAKSGGDLGGITEGRPLGRTLMEVDGGLTRHLSASAGVVTLHDRDRVRGFARAGLRGFFGLLSASADVAGDLDGGVAAQGTLRTQVGTVSLALDHTWLRHFESERFVPLFGPLRGRTSLRADGTVPFGRSLHLPMSLELRRDWLESGGAVNQLTNRIAAFPFSSAVSNELTWILPDPGSSAPHSLIGRTLFGKDLRSFSVRGEVAYALQPVLQLTGAALTAETRAVRGLVLSAGVAHAPGNTRFLAGIGRDEGAFAFGLNAQYGTRDGFAALATIAVGLSRDASTGRWHAQAHSAARTGAASARVFLDENGNGVFDPNEQPLRNVGLRMNGALQGALTSDAGQTFLTRLPVHRYAELSLSPQTLEDPFWMPVREGVRFVPRPGKVARLDYPVQVAGEVTGTIWIREGDSLRPASGVQVQVLRGAEAIRTTYSAYDGFYDLAGLAPGAYTLRISPPRPLRPRVAPPAEALVEIAPDGTAIDGQDFTLEVKQETAGAMTTGPTRPRTAP